MADITLSRDRGGRRRPAAPRIDLTPMVDLGFLLISFFMFTTTLARPKAMQVDMPYQSDVPAHTEIPAESSITLIPSKDHRVAWYKGTLKPGKAPAWCGFGGAHSVRTLLQDMQQDVKSLPPTFSKEAHLLHVLIKPDADSKYGDVVALLDEMSILNVPYYVLMDETAAEKEWIRE